VYANLESARQARAFDDLRVRVDGGVFAGGVVRVNAMAVDQSRAGVRRARECHVRAASGQGRELRGLSQCGARGHLHLGQDGVCVETRPFSIRLFGGNRRIQHDGN
jgi:hypothetical protein